MVKMTFKQYDKVTSNFSKVNMQRTFWPTKEQFDEMNRNPDLFVLYACYLYECNDAPKNESEKESKRQLFKFINDNLTLID